MNNRLKTFRQELLDELEHDILPFWIERVMAPAESRFYGRIGGDGRLYPDADQSAVLYGRLVWTFSAAYRMTGSRELLAAATCARNYLFDHFIDPEYGGVYWSVHADGTPANMRKQFYALGFAIYGLSEYARATGDERSAKEAWRLFEAIEAHSFDSQHGGYLEAAARDWSPLEDVRLSDKDANEHKTMNTHLHILEGYANLLRLYPSEERLRNQTRRLLECFFTHIMTPDGHLGLFFDETWHNRYPNDVSFGHDIEASWLLFRTAQTLGDGELLKRAHDCCIRIAEAALEGYQPDGSMIYERHADGKIDSERHWWVQAETVIGLYYLYRYFGQPKAIEGAMRTWEYIRTHLIDREGGEWWWSILPNGAINRSDDKAGFWKCPYHNARMCMEVTTLIGSEGN
ncbi:N-acyl-D-glucosamine 2-epimerase [Alistipes sp. An116]|uniref:AGE family epimerase/isomerase n=1 Tax=Alistipes sp. An116 TaxID=1965546 RepID=UPI000B3920A9|nr:AGE family epimerase/isomerase [Alistipes sp. An116]OUQ53964.1 N-acyl-D-glucosamine 2-epimerase [Alistipes sp. An116]